MGLYDYVDFKANCPDCGEEETHWQTKEMVCRMEVLNPSLVSFFYTICDNCDAWISYTRQENCGCPKHSCNSCWNHSCELEMKNGLKN
jgi:hypothetical protein